MFPLFLAHVVFWAALLAGASRLRPWSTGVFVALWIAGHVGARWLPTGDFLFVSFAAVLGIVLVRLVVRGDVSLR